MEKPSYDCHGKTYAVVKEEFENWFLMNVHLTPLDVITGNSTDMKKVITDILDIHSMKYGVPSYNTGMIIVF